METESVGRGDDQIARRPDPRTADQPRVEIGGEEDRAGKGRAQCVEHQELVVSIVPQHADSAYAVATLAFFLPIAVGQLPREAPEVVVLAAAVRTLERRLVEKRVAGIRCARVLPGGCRHRRSGTFRQDAVEATQRAHGEDTGFPEVAAFAGWVAGKSFLEVFLKVPRIARVAFRDQNNRARTKRIPVQRGSVNAPEGGRIDEPQPQLRLRSEEHTSELQSQFHLVCRLLLEKKKKQQ